MAKEIYKKLLALQQAVVGLTKDAKGNAGDYVSGNKLLGIVRPMMDKLGLLLTKDVLEYHLSLNCCAFENVCIPYLSVPGYSMRKPFFVYVRTLWLCSDVISRMT